ncbi:alpha/beta hydrolase [Pseudoxanthomonas daejeonensis]|uniref:alpha/beta hydrolase n=1 Tax=Pseudoxanthomonas daejeonensis TaxID=266062 RepID=UPI001F543CD8|nr:alpha/beta hydrolase [Pseudoxanthomonas daejeonensis]UNK57489.1 alpha/beta hydrolase [Pseudoxanthomonas daejeonensis]
MLRSSTRLLACLLMLFALAACQPPVRLMPAPAVFLNGEHNLFGANANLDRSSDIQVFYATNRVPFGPSGARAYTVFPGDELHLGVANLSIGGGGRSWDWLYEQSTNASAERRPQLLVNSMDEKASVAPGASVDEPGEEALAFLRLVDEALARSADPNLTIYVHGANTSVGRATAQAAQYRHFTGRNSVVLSFIWPSAENFMRFSHDVAKAGGTAPAFAQLVRMLSQHTRARHINVIAYSSGAMVASPGLAILGTATAGYDPASARLGEVYFPAPDADFRQFVSELQVYHGYPQRVTVTVNMRDSVLVLSRLHQRGSRAGRPDPTELSPEDAQWMIDASNRLDFDLISASADDLPGMDRRSHIFWYDHPWVSSDVLLKMLFHMAPEERGLQRNQNEADLQFWTFPENYEARLDEVMDQLVQTASAPPAAGMEAKGTTQ